MVNFACKLASRKLFTVLESYPGNLKEHMELKSRHPHGFHLLAQRVSGYLFMVAGQREARGSNRTIDSARSARRKEND